MTSLDRIRRLGSALAGALVLAMIGSGSAGAAAPPPVDYVNLGDSYSAGWGASTSFERNPAYGDLPVECFVSGPDHVTLLDQLRVVELVKVTPNGPYADYACAGARLDRIFLEAQLAVEQGTLHAGTDLVTLTAGGNDVGFETVLGQCLALKQAGATCSDLFAAVNAQLPAITQGVTAAAGYVRTLAWNARIVWAGYPHLITADPAAPLPGAGLLTLEEAAAFNMAIDGLNAAIAAGVAAVPNTQYVSVVEKFTGHELGTADPWITPLVLDPTNPAALFNLHPNATGYALGYYPAIVSKVKPAQLPRS